MTNPILISTKLKLKRNSLTSLEEKLQSLLAKRDEFEAAFEAVESEEELGEIEISIEQNNTKISDLEKEKNKLQEEIEGLETELEELNKKSPDQQGGQRKMQAENVEVREAINRYVRTKEQTRDFTTVDGGALIPDELLAPQRAPEDIVDLSQLVRTVRVNSGAGKFPVIKKSGSAMVSVAELAQNPELANPTITEVPYDIETYRGYIPVSQEAIDDADYDITGMIAEEIADQELNTRNAAIADVLKTATPMTATGLDGLKSIFNTELKRVYNARAIISASLFNELDTLKDNEGRYLLQTDITVASGKRLFGKEVVVLDDDVIGTAPGDLVGFIGDSRAFVTLFDRRRASVKWIDNNVYGQLLAGFVRFDVAATDTDAGFYVTYTPDVAGA